MVSQLNLVAASIDMDSEHFSWTEGPIPAHTSPIEHYIEHGLPKCSPFNEYFSKKPELLQNSDGSCAVNDWLKFDWEKDKITKDQVKILNDIILHEYRKFKKAEGVSFYKVIASYKEFQSNLAENLLGHGILIDAKIAELLLKDAHFKFSDKLIKHCEQIASKDQADKNLMSMLLGYSFNHAADYGNTEDSHSIFLSELMLKPKYKEHIENFSFYLEKAALADGIVTKEQSGAVYKNQYFPPKFYKNVEKLLEAAVGADPLQANRIITFLATGIVKDDYTPNPEMLELLLQTKLVNDLDNQAIEILLADLLEQPTFDHQIVAKSALHLLDNNYKMNASLISNLVKAFESNNSLFLPVIVEIIAAKIQIPSDSVGPLGESLLKIIDNSSNPSELHNAIFVISRMHSHSYELPKNLTSHFAKFLVGDDIYMQKLALNIFKEFSQDLSPQEKRMLLNFSGSFETEAAALKIISAENKKAAARYDELIELENDKLSMFKLLLEIDEIDVEMDSKSAFALVTYVKHLNNIGWPPKLLSALLKNLHSDNLSYFMTCIAHIHNYSMTFDMIDRDGRNVVDILSNSVPESWLGQLKQLYRDSHYYVEKEQETLFDQIDELNKESNQEIVAVRAKITEQLGKIAEHDKKFNNPLEISYNGEPKILKENIVYLFSKDDVLQYKILSDGKIFSGVFDESNLDQDSLIRIQNVFSFQQPIYVKDLESISKVSGFFDHWTEEQFLQFKSSIKNVTDENLAEIVSVIKHAIYLTTGHEEYTLRTAQVVAILYMYMSNNGRLAQIATGEGKGMIIACFAALTVYDNRVHDIITSAVDLAQRDYDENKNFFKMLGISVSHNTGPSLQGQPKDCYLSSVVYGDPLNFIADYLSDVTAYIKHGRPIDTVTLDEVDSYTIDELTKKVQRSSPIPGFETLDQLLIYLWGFAYQINSMIYTDKADNQNYRKKPKGEADFIPNSVSFEDFDLEPIEGTRVEIVSQAIDQHLLKLLKPDSAKNNQDIVIAKQLYKFVFEHAEIWKESIFDAMFYQKDVDYTFITITTKVNGEDITRNFIAPTDKIHTGQVQKSTILSGGLHQFLQIKEHLGVTSESLTSIFKSYAGYLQKYTGNIYGLTGTLGTKDHQNFLHDVYGVDTVLMPNYITKDLVVFPAIVETQHQDWLNDITSSVHQIAKNEDRAVLIIVETINEVKEILTALILSKYPSDMVKLYIYDTDKHILEAHMEPGAVIISTYIGGRGTDLKLTKEVLENGGLHTILASNPESIKNTLQAYGRSARKDDPGSAQSIILTSEDDPCHGDMACLSERRDEKEMQDLKNTELCDLGLALFEDKFFEKYVALTRKINSPTDYEIVTDCKDDSNHLQPHKTICPYTQEGKLHIKIRMPNSSEIKILDINQQTMDINPDLHKHMLSVLNKNESGAALGQNDIELLHFLAAMHLKLDLKILDHINRLYIKSLPIVGRDDEVKDYIDKKPKKNLKYSDSEQAFLEEYVSKQPNHNEPITDAELRIAKSKILYKFWLEDRAMYNNEYEIQQVTELWGMWLAKSMHVFSNLGCDASDEDSVDEAKKLIEKVSKELEQSFEQFKNQILEDFHNGTLIVNPSYYIRKAYHSLNIAAYLDQLRQDQDKKQLPTSIPKDQIKQAKAEAVSYCEKAKSLDPVYSWQASLCLAYTTLIRDQDELMYLVEHGGKAAELKSTINNHLNAAVETLYTVLIPQHEAQIYYLIAAGIADKDSEIIDKLYKRIEFHTLIAKHCQDQIKRVIQASVTSAPKSGKGIEFRELVEKGEREDFDQHFNGTFVTNSTENFALNSTTSLSPANATESLFTLLNESNANEIKTKGSKQIDMYPDIYGEVEIFLFEIDFHELDKPKKKSGLLSGLMILGFAALSISMGIYCAGMNSVFMQAFGTSLVMAGISEIINLGITIANDQPISLDNYFKGKVISLAIGLATAGFTAIADAAGVIKYTNSIPKLPTGEVATKAYLEQAFLQSVAVKAINIGLSKTLTNVAKANDGDMEHEIEREINEFIEQHREELLTILASDQWKHNHQGIEHLMQKAQQIMNRYSKRFNNDAEQIAKGTIDSVLASGIAAAVNVGLGLHKMQEMMDNFNSHFAYAVAEEAKHSVHSRQMMQEQLESHKDLDRKDAAAIMHKLVVNNFVQGSDIKYKKCAEIKSDQFDLGSYAEKRELVFALCDKIAKAREAQLGQLANLKSTLTGKLHSSQFASLESDVITPFSNFAAPKVKQGFDYMVEHIKAGKPVHKQESLAEQAKKADEKIAKDPGKYKLGKGGGKPKPPLDLSEDAEISNAEAELRANLAQLNQAIDARTDLSDESKQAQKQQIAKDLKAFAELPEAEQQAAIADLENQSSESSSLFGAKSAHASVGAVPINGGIDFGAIAATVRDAYLVRVALQAVSAAVIKGGAAATAVIIYINEVASTPGVKIDGHVTPVFYDPMSADYDVELAQHVEKTRAAKATVTSTVTMPIIKPEVKPAPVSVRTVLPATKAPPPAVKPTPPAAKPVAPTVSPALPPSYTPTNYAGYTIPHEEQITMSFTPVTATDYSELVSTAQDQPFSPAFDDDYFAELMNSLAKKSHNSDNKVKLKQGPTDAITGLPDPDFDPDDEDNDPYKKYKVENGSKRYECEPSQSPIWRSLKNHKKGNELKTNGLKGKEKRLYRWDIRHHDIEVYDGKGRDFGSVDPVTGKLYRPGTGKVNPRVEKWL